MSDLDDLVDVTTTGPVQQPEQDTPEPATLMGKAKAVVIRTKQAAIAWGRKQTADKTTGWSGYCLRFVRSCFNAPAHELDAKAAWYGANRKHRTTDPEAIPRGKPVFWEVGKYWHVALSLGNGLCRSNDTRGDDHVHVARIADISRAWNATLLGWTDDINGYDVPAPGAKPKPKPQPASLKAFKRRYLTAALKRAQAQGATARVRLIRRWLNQLEGK